MRGLFSFAPPLGCILQAVKKPGPSRMQSLCGSWRTFAYSLPIRVDQGNLHARLLASKTPLICVLGAAVRPRCHVPAKITAGHPPKYGAPQM